MQGIIDNQEHGHLQCKACSVASVAVQKAQVELSRDTQLCMQIIKGPGMQTSGRERRSDKQTDRQTDRDRRKCGQTDRQTNRHVDAMMDKCRIISSQVKSERCNPCMAQQAVCVGCFTQPKRKLQTQLPWSDLGKLQVWTGAPIQLSTPAQQN